MIGFPPNAIERRKRGCSYGPRKHGRCPAKKHGKRKGKR